VVSRRTARITAGVVGLGLLSATLVGALPAAAATTAALGYDPATDGGSMSMITSMVGAQAMWAKGYTGKGVDVAVIDTGVTRVPGLDQAGKVIDGPDLSFDSQNAAFAHLDGYGHGTNMASIIAGSDVVNGTAKSCATCLVSSTYSDTTKFVGVAPDARIVNVKAGASDGATDVSQVIAAIDWVVEHQHDNGMNIRVINLSYGTDSTQAANVDPLSYAAEVAWRKGIVVVVSAGNDGLFTPSLASPAYNPTLLAVGSVDNRNTASILDDLIPSYAQHGSSARKVDVVAPGSHVLGLRVPGSVVDSTVTTGKVGTRFQRGSGTSQAAAVVSGMAALLLQRYPTATPDQVKAFLKAEADRTVSTTSIPASLAPLAEMVLDWWQGAGVASVAAATASGSLPAATPAPAYGTGTGTLEAARGTTHLVSNGVTLTGEKDVLTTKWDGVRWSGAAWAGTSWSGGKWNGVRWSGDGWSGARWSTTVWSGSDWAGVRWSGVRWSAMTWTGVRWSGTGWTGVRWSDAVWSGARWSTATMD
jgi:serine protease AprX